MENACGQNCRRVAFLNDFHHVIQIAGSAAGYHRHRDGISNAPRQIHVITGLGAVAVYAVQNDLSRAKFHRALSPLDSIQPGIFAASLDKDFLIIDCSDPEGKMLPPDDIFTKIKSAVDSRFK